MGNRILESVRTIALHKTKNVGPKKISGFTLAELIVVVTILAILATIGFLALSGYTDDAKSSVVKTNVRSVYSSIMAESASTGNSPRYYVIHDPNYALSGGVVVFDGNPTTLSWGDWNVPGTNYSAGNPDYVKLKLNKDKFKAASSDVRGYAFLSRILGSADAASAADPTYLLVGATDVTDMTSGKARNRSYFQVAAVTTSNVATVSGNFPTALTGSVTGLVKDASNPSSTGALLDGSGIWGTASCTVPASDTHSSIAYVLSSTGTVSHGQSAIRTGTSAFGTSPSNGSLTANFNYSCNNGNLSKTTSGGGGSCQAGYTWNSNYSSPACTQTSYVFTYAVSSNVSNFNLRAQAISAGWNQILPIAATVTVNAGVTVGSSSAGTPAFDATGSFPVGSSFSLVNNGNILGKWGDGGYGGTWNGSPSAGGTWGSGLSVALATTVQNNGIVAWGGGGGGGGGGGSPDCSSYCVWGGGGGGWAGSTVGNGGGGVGCAGNGGLNASSAGAAGGSSLGGTGANGGYNGAQVAGKWGNGWSLGTAGGGGVNASTSCSPTAGAAGGAAGAAINGNSNITWLANGTKLWASN